MLGLLRVSRNRLQLFSTRLHNLKKPLLLYADIAIAFVQTVSARGELESCPPQELRAAFQRHMKALIEFGLIKEPDLGKRIPALQVTSSQLPDLDAIYCILDPFSYISHLSALQWHGLTGRIPKTLFVSRPDRTGWQELASKKLFGQLNDNITYFKEARLPGYQTPHIHKLRTRPINVWQSGRLNKVFNASYIHPANSFLRIATIGRCFLDMVRKPDLCGGINHVADIFHNHATPYIDEIIKELESYGNKIEQARAGFLLEEVNKIKNQHLDKWASNTTRGGSRKLDPEADYEPNYSERWNLSINAYIDIENI